MVGGGQSADLAQRIGGLAVELEIPFDTESSVWPSAAGFVPEGTPVLCGMGPMASEPYTPNEGVERISLLQRTLLLASFLAAGAEGNGRRSK